MKKHIDDRMMGDGFESEDDVSFWLKELKAAHCEESPDAVLLVADYTAMEAIRIPLALNISLESRGFTVHTGLSHGVFSALVVAMDGQEVEIQMGQTARLGSLALGLSEPDVEVDETDFANVMFFALPHLLDAAA